MANKYTYMGEWESKPYSKSSAVLYAEKYYRATDDTMATDKPSESILWKLIAYPIQTNTISINDYDMFVDTPMAYGYGNREGLYQFPNKNTLSSNVPIRERHFHKMGVQMMYQFAMEYYEANKDSMPNITGIYVMQGDRKKNIITQGFSVAAVESVGFSLEVDANDGIGQNVININQSSKIGNHNTDLAFPIIGGDNYRLFPIMKISRGRVSEGGNKHKVVLRVEEDSISHAVVSPYGDIVDVKVDGDPISDRYDYQLQDSSKRAFDCIKPSKYQTEQQDEYNNIKTNKFCIYTPDILIDKGISLPSNLFIKSIQKLSIDDNNLRVSSPNVEKSYASLFAFGAMSDRNTPSNTYVYANERYYDFEKSVYNSVDIQLFSSDSAIINTNTINGIFGFSTRMKSIIEVFGFDYKSGITDGEASFIANFMETSRDDLLESGILLNKYRWDDSDSLSIRPYNGDLVFGSDSSYTDQKYKKYPFSYGDLRAVLQPGLTLNGEIRNIVTAPQIFTNLSMQSLPYVGVKLPARHKYSSMASLATREPSYQDLHNAIVNLCIYEDDKTYREAIHNEFNILSEIYKVIEYTDTWNVEGENLLLNSDKYISNSNYLLARYTLSEKWIPGEAYVLAIKGKVNPGQHIRVYRDSGYLEGAIIHFPESDGDLHVSSFICPAKAPLDDVENIISIYNHDESGAKHGYIEWIKIEKGDTFTGYSKAPQDEILLRGDIFSQKTFMRVVRWSDLPDVMTTPKEGWDWSYSWKYGQAINVYLQSRVNTYLRSVTHDSTYINDALRDYDNREDAIANFIWKNTSMRYLNESWRTNDGYNVTHGLLELAAFNETVMKRAYEAKNRIYASNVHVGGAIADAYREIPAGQYRDYNFDGGEIVALAKFNNMLFSVQRSALLQHYTSKQLTQSEDSSTIITGNKEVLSDQFRELATYGSQHRDSIVEGMMGIYGIDWNREKIWRITQKHGEQGHVFYVAEDLATSKQSYDIFKLIKTDNKPLDETVYDKGGIVSTYDDENKLVLFTFHILDRETTKRYTLGFSEEIDNFIGFYDYTNEIYMKLDGRLFGYSSSNKYTKNNKVVSNELWEHNANDDYLKLYGDYKPLELEFIVNCASEQQNASQFEKEFMSHLITSSHLKFDLVEWETEWQESEMNPFVSDTDFWRNPEYREHTWRVPIIYNDKNSVTGPLGSEEFKTFESDSAMRGQWLKVKLKYVPLNGQEDIQFYIKNVITNFIISYS